MAKNLVAKVARVANAATVSAAERTAVLLELPKYVSSAADGLGLLSLRPSDQTARKGLKSAKAKDRVRKRARTNRAIGGGPKGQLLQAIYARIAMWIAKNGTPVHVVASDAEIIELLPYIVGPAIARRVTGSIADQKRTMSQMAFDWRSVIGQGVTTRVENSEVAVTFYLDGGDGERRFSLAVDIGSTPVIERPVAGTTPPLSLSTIVEETKRSHSPYMQWAELIRAAALNGDRVAQSAVLLINTTRVAGKAFATLIGVLGLIATVFFALPLPEAHAKVIDHVNRWISEWTVTNETPDGRLPERLRLHTPPTFSNEDTDVHFLSDTEAMFTIRKPEEILRRAEKSDPTYVGAHIEWEWQVTVGKRSKICKHTENAQLHMFFDSTMARENVTFSVAPLIVRHSVSGPFTVGVPGPAGPLTPPKPGDFDQGDVLVVADPRTYNTCVVP